MTEVNDWSDRVENGEELAVIIIDQSAAYNTIDHKILLKKMDIIGFDTNTIKYFKNYLSYRRQQIHLEGTISDELHIGNMSVVQGSTLTLIRESAGIYARTLLYCTVLYTHCIYPKYQSPYYHQIPGSSDLYFKIRSLLSSLLIYRNFPAVW